MQKTLKVLMIAACTFAVIQITRCTYEDSTVKEGVVSGKTYTPAWAQTQIIDTGNGSLVPIITYHPEQYRVKFIGKSYKGREREVSFAVSASDWNNYEEGQHVRRD